ncbi:MAG: alpha-L-rhamnosidase C-terminal domain-containing protein, partial [Flavitalea sp.]
MNYRKALLSLIIGLMAGSGIAQIPQPFKALHSGKFVGKPIANSPDPLSNFYWNDPKAADSLQIYTLQPQKYSFSPAKSFTRLNKEIRVNGAGDMMLDFAVESAGWLEFDCDMDLTSVEASISEYNEPAVFNYGSQNPVKTRAVTKYGKSYRLELNDLLYEGVRFAWIHVRKFSKPFTIKNIRLVCQVKPANYKGSFQSDDTLLNRIWYTGAYVVKLNALQDFFGAILMERSDRHSWTGDAYPAQAASLAAFGNYDDVAKNIAFTSNQDNGIATYSIYWVLSLIEYYQFTGDKAFFKRFVPNADKRLSLAIKQFDSVPDLAFTGWDERLGGGFENGNIAEARFAFRMLCLNAWKKFAKALEFADDQTLSAKYTATAADKTKALQEDFTNYGVHAISEAINAGLSELPAVQKQSSLIYGDRVKRLSYSPFNQYFILQAMSLSGSYKEAFQTIYDNWGEQIKYGATSYFEVFRPSWNQILKVNDAPPNNQCGYTSIAHPWGAGVTKWMSENILGIIPVAPGFASFNILPHIGNLQKVSGEMPTPSGNIKVSIDRKAGIFSFAVPSGTHARKVGVPLFGKKISELTINNEKKSFNNLKSDDEFLYIENLAEGNWNVSVKYTQAVTVAANPVDQYNYGITNFSQDSLTKGNWKTKYGSQGFKLFGLNEKLPAFIDSVTVRLPKTVVVALDSLPAMAAKSVLQSEDLSHLYYIATRDPLACLQTMTLDLWVNDNKEHKVSLYFLDADLQNRRSSIEVFDAKTFELIA